ncbi:hypothetical protein MRB53_034855 [Persea americana]|uniref:Uncharacterized protein n=1 Tax=Persea americana TaxID=3435 RepID=A0ACC2K399_PERAE|nr:hypothetical protein MRB53_034855 [Persea americana]|eukprot:TRINITY_DN14455_c0_g1_i1.p1 TRINITY_DN14455_c0_g1~~TRINITY_DN14455_c0_g1_i1.p1  ORF type:complete len:220 (+),score=47.79 TRINITY_DN14455_c0_g1_i1:227-886(+)
MDVEFWSARVQSAKHLAAMQSSRLSAEALLCLADSEGDEEMRALFPCPFCYVDIEVAVLCTHLQEEHCFDVKNAVCPVCAENLGRDMVGHFTMQHAHMLKRRRKSQRTGLWTNSSAMPGKELRELSSFLGEGAASVNARRSTVDSMPDPLLSPFLCGLTLSDAKDKRDANSGIDSRVVPTPVGAKSTELSTSDGDREQDDEERKQRAEFVQMLVLSTIF